MFFRVLLAKTSREDHADGGRSRKKAPERIEQRHSHLWFGRGTLVVERGYVGIQTLKSFFTFRINGNNCCNHIMNIQS